ncbi:uncharacterized protein LOC132550079 [Ylistrum balloti]|uniref:uncharacterized protein LOC132550079 n=1 Tax=Ylistrum balloti TaxID=509963 RepID=UPI002905C556|nr:uncharacterized protein LOC132550079 [Ylistrum balloti]
MNIWTISATLLLHITSCYCQQKSTWWSGQASPPAARTATQRNSPGGQVVNPSWNQAPKSWPNSEPTGWSASQKRRVTVKPRIATPPNRRTPNTPGQKWSGGKNGVRNYNWKPGAYPYPQVKKPASSQWISKSSSTWRAPGMQNKAPPTRGNSWGQNRAPSHKVNKVPKPHELVKGWTTTGTQSLWTDQGNNKKAPIPTSHAQRSGRHHIPAWLQKRPIPAKKRRENTAKSYHANVPRGPPFQQPRPGFTPKPYPQTGYTGYNSKTYARESTKKRLPPRPPTRFQNDQRHRPSRRHGDNPTRNTQYHRERHLEVPTPPDRRQELRTALPTRSNPRSEIHRDPLADNHRPSRLRSRTSTRTEPSSPKRIREGHFETNQAESFHRSETKRVDILNQNEPRQSQTKSTRKRRPRKKQPSKTKQSDALQPEEPRRRKTNSKVESARSETFTGIETSRGNIVARKEQAIHVDPTGPSSNGFDTRKKPVPSAQPNHISNTPKLDSNHYTSNAHPPSNNDPIPSEALPHADRRISNSITQAVTGIQITNIEPLSTTVAIPSESVSMDTFTTSERPKHIADPKGRKEKRKTLLNGAVIMQTTVESRHANDISDKTNTPVPQESVQLAVEVKPIHPTKAAEQQYERDPMTEKIIAELKRKLKILSMPKSTAGDPDVNVSVSVLEVLKQKQGSSADPAQETMLSKTRDKMNTHLKDLHLEPNPDIIEIHHGESATRSSNKARHPEFAHPTDMHYEEVAEPRWRSKDPPPHGRSAKHRQTNPHPNDRHVEPTPPHDQVPQRRSKSHLRKADVHEEIGYYEGVTEVRRKPTSHPEATGKSSRKERNHSYHKKRRVIADGPTVDPAVEFIGKPYADNHEATSKGRKRPVSDPRAAPLPERKTLRRTQETGDILSVYDSKTDTYIEPSSNFSPRPKSEADLWGKSQPAQPAPTSVHGMPPHHWGPDSHAPSPHMGPPTSHIPAPDPYASPSDPRAPQPPAYNDDNWPGRQPSYPPGTADAFTNQHPSVNSDLHMAGHPGYAPDPYHGHPQGPHPYEYQGGPQAPYPPEPYPPAGPPESYPAGPPESYHAVGQPGAYYQDPHQPAPYVPAIGPVDPYGPPPTVNSGPIYHTPATIPTTTDDDPPATPAAANPWYPTVQPPVGQHPPPYHTTPSPLTNFDPYPGPHYAQPPPDGRPPPAYDTPQFDQYTIRYPDGSASKEEYTEVTSAVQRIVNYVYDSTLRIYKIADYFVMDRNTDSFAIRIAKDMCYVGTIDSAILDSFTEYTLKTRNATEPVIYSNERLFFFKEIEQVFFADVNSTRGGYIAGSCGDAFMFRVRMVKPRIILMNDGSVLPGSTCPYGAPMKEPQGQVTSCKSGYCHSREHTCNPTHHICCPKKPESTRCMHLSIGKFCVSYSKNNVIIN